MNLQIRRLVVTSLFLAHVAASSLFGAQEPAPGDFAERLDKVETTLEVIREYNDDLLSIVSWSLGTLFATALLLVGFNWFQSNRLLRRDVESLRAELRSLVDARVAETESPLRERVEESIASHAEVTKKLVDDRISAAIAPLKTRLGNHHGRLGAVEYNAEEAEVKLWLQKDVPSNACRGAARLVGKGVELGHDFFVSEALDLLENSLSLLQAKDGKLDSSDLKAVEAALDGVREEHAAAYKALSAKLHVIQST